MGGFFYIKTASHKLFKFVIEFSLLFYAERII